MATVPLVHLYRPVGPVELDLIRHGNFRRFPPRLPGQPIFYPVLQQAYAEKIAREWNVSADGAGFVTRFAMEAGYLTNFSVQIVGGRLHSEYWIPADLLEEFNDHIVGQIEVVGAFGIGGVQ